MTEGIGAALVGLGVAFDVVGCLGLLRLPDVYSRMQAATKCVALGTLLIVAGAVLMAGSSAVLAKGALCLIFLVLTSPTGSHALARAAHRSGTPLWEGSLLDRLAEDGEERR